MCWKASTRTSFWLLLSFLGITLLVPPAVSQDSLLISYQGRLTDDLDQPITGTPALTFTIYDGSGISKWTETHPSVQVENGLFDVNLGSQKALPMSVFDGSDRYLGIVVDGGPEISPRTLLTSAPGAAYSFHAVTADTAGYVEKGVGATQLIMNDEIELWNGFSHFLGIDSINAPAEGYAMCHATVNLYCDHLTGTDACINIEFMDSTLTHLTEQEFYWCLPPALPSDEYLTTLSIHRIFPVNPGYNRFNLVGSDFREAGDRFFVRKRIFTITYVPRSYGTIQTTKVTSGMAIPPEPIILDDQVREELRKSVQRKSDTQK
jgi:hypothetical protein